MSSPRAFIFDLDGVLTHTSELHFRAWRQVAAEAGIPFDRNDNENLRGVSREESLRRLLAGREVGDDAFRAMLNRKNQYYLAGITTLGPRDLAPGVAPLLAELRSMGMMLAVASASRNAQQVVDRLAIREWVHAVLDGASVERGKPAPDLFLAAAAAVGCPPETCVVVEDAEAGVEAAMAAGMRCIVLGPAARRSPGAARLASFIGMDARSFVRLALSGRCPDRVEQELRPVLVPQGKDGAVQQ